MDTIKRSAYRAETALADLLPNETGSALSVRLQHSANPASDKAICVLAQLLNESETLYHATNLRTAFNLVSNENPGDQEI